MTDELRVTMSHARQAKMCSRGVREFCKRYGIDYDEFLNDGVPVSIVEATGDAMALECVKVAQNGRQQ